MGLLGFASSAWWLVSGVIELERSFLAAYKQHLQEMETDAWLHAQCLEPHFQTNMGKKGLHDICERVLKLFAKPPWMAGLEACLPDGWLQLMWSLRWLLAGGGVLGLLWLLPLYRKTVDDIEQARILRRKPPLLPAHMQMPATRQARITRLDD